MKKSITIILILISLSSFAQRYLISADKKYIQGVADRITAGCIKDSVWKDYYKGKPVTNCYGNAEANGKNTQFRLLYYVGNNAKDSLKYGKYWLASEMVKLQALPADWNVQPIDTIAAIQYNADATSLTIRYKLVDSLPISTTLMSVPSLNPQWNAVKTGLQALFPTEVISSICYQNKTQNTLQVERFNVMTIQGNLYDCRIVEALNTTLIPMDLQYKIYFLSEKIKSILKN